MTSMRKDKIDFANSCRGIAALSVAIVHLVIAFWVEQPVVGQITGLPPLGFPVPLFATLMSAIPLNFAAFGVALFFIVSGFVIPISLERYDARAFLAGRLIRIWPTYWAGFSISAGALILGVRAFGGVLPFNSVQAIVHYFPPLRAFVYSKPIDGIIWTLEIEFLWYFVAAAIAGPLRRGALTAFFAPVGLFALFVAAWLFTDFGPSSMEKIERRFDFIVVYAPFVIFIFCGVALNFRQRNLIGRAACGAMICLCLALLAAAGRTGRLAGILEMPSYLAALAVFIAIMAWPARFENNRFFSFLARISYPLYVVHGVAGYVLLHTLLVWGANPWAALAATLAAAIGAAAVLHEIVEKPSHLLAQKASRGLTRRLALRAAPPETSTVP